jgi:hypothetical protein
MRATFEAGTSMRSQPEPRDQASQKKPRLP